MNEWRRIHLRTLLPLLLFACAAIAETPPLEYEVRAAFLLNFTKFVQWPAPPPGESNSPLAICILGADPFGGVLEQVVEGESVGGRKIVVRKLRAPEANSCAVVYIAQNEKASPEAFAHDVLTVGEGNAFLRRGGMIAFVIDNRRVRFDVNRRAAERAGLALSSQLLKVARNVEQ